MVKLANGQKMNLILPDGTEVTLNAGSIFAYSNYFNSGDREVRIEGEAFFNVAKNNGTPFIVHAGSARLRVIGTEFSVKAWPEVTEVRLVVREGNVAFSAENDALGEQAVVVRRGEVSTLAGGRVSPPWKASLDNELAWLRGELVFEATPFEHVIRSLERKFDIHCTVSDSTILGRQLTATFKDETTDEVLDVIALSLQLAYSRNQDSVTFAPRDR
jgi:ferric-dicitrate binding protein FerR (iron transport regulator)